MADLKLKQVSSSKYIAYGVDNQKKMHHIGDFVEDFNNKRFVWVTKGLGSDKFGEDFISQIACALRELDIKLKEMFKK